MILIPIETEKHDADAAIIVVSEANLERMRAADPVELDLSKCGHTLINPRIMICVERENDPRMAALMNAGDLAGVIAYLTRGFKFRPEKGDHDRGPERLADQQ